MRIETTSVDEFIEVIEKEIEAGGDLWMRRVHCQVDRVPTQSVPIWEAETARVTFQATCLVNTKIGQYLLVFASQCGVDVMCENDNPGSDAAQRFRDRIDEWASATNHQVMPGVIHE